MGKQGRKQRKRGGIPSRDKVSSNPKISASKAKRITMGLLVGLCLVVSALVTALTERRDKKPVETKVSETIITTPQSLDDLLTLPESELGKVDFALMNLLCAQGLPGSENLDIQACLSTLDKWAEYALAETIRHMYKFKRAPQDYENSEGYFRILVLNTVLQQDLGVHYNLERIRDVDFRNSKDLFIHGMINDRNGGTCASMPVLLIAIARRMGYPVKLVSTKGHLFCRWETPGDRINMESSGIGLNSYKDDYYKTWPMMISDEEVKREGFLISMTPREELGCFMAARGDCLLDNGRLKEAEKAYASALRLSPGTYQYRLFMADAQMKHRPRPLPHRLEDVSYWSPDLPESIEGLEFNKVARKSAEEFNKKHIPNTTVNPVMTPDMWGHLPQAAH